MLKSFFKRSLLKMTTSTGTIPIIEDPGKVYLKEQQALMDITKKNIIIRFKNKLWQLLHYPVKNISWLSFIAVITVIISVTITVMVFKYGPKADSLSSEKYSILSRIQEIKTKNDLYYKATKEERLIKWIVMFSDWKYALGGDYKQKNADCLGASNLYLQQWGLNIVLESIPLLVKRMENLSDRGELKIKKTLDNVKSGDIIIFSYANGTNLHVGFVYDITSGYCRYFDMNADVQTWGFDKIKWGNPNIWIVGEISYSLSLGNLMQELNK